MPWSEKLTKEASKTLSYYLRHAPWEAELIPDTAGWVSMQDLISALNDSYAGLVTVDTIKKLIVLAVDNDQFDISDDETRIRARNGHTASMAQPYEPAKDVPQILYHGTTEQNATSIKACAAVKPMARQFVHWTSDPELAKNIARRYRGKKHVMFFLDARSAHAEGITFYDCKNGIWLTPEMPAQYTTKGPKF